MFTSDDATTVSTYFAAFKNTPPVILDVGQNTAQEAYILIDGCGLSIGKHLRPAQQVISKRFVPGYVYLVYDHNGEDDGNEYKDFGSAIKAAMLAYAAEMFRRTNDQLATAAQAADFALDKQTLKGDGQ
jgi:hypothetical protein